MAKLTGLYSMAKKEMRGPKWSKGTMKPMMKESEMMMKKKKKKVKK